DKVSRELLRRGNHLHLSRKMWYRQAQSIRMQASPHFSARRPLALTGALLFAASVNAQLVNDGATNTLSNVTNSFIGDVTVGTNGAFTLLVLSNNALLT